MGVGSIPWGDPQGCSTPSLYPPASPKAGALGAVVTVFIQPRVCQSSKASSLRLFQGDGNIRYYEIGSEKPYLSYLMEFRSPAPQKGLGKGGRAAEQDPTSLIRDSAEHGRGRGWKVLN